MGLENPCRSGPGPTLVERSLLENVRMGPTTHRRYRRHSTPESTRAATRREWGTTGIRHTSGESRKGQKTRDQMVEVSGPPEEPGQNIHSLGDARITREPDRGRPVCHPRVTGWILVCRLGVVFVPTSGPGPRVRPFPRPGVHVVTRWRPPPSPALRPPHDRTRRPLSVPPRGPSENERITTGNEGRPSPICTSYKTTLEAAGSSPQGEESGRTSASEVSEEKSEARAGQSRG